MSELYPSQTIIGGSGSRYLVVDNHNGILTLLRPLDDHIFDVDWLEGKDHVVEVISSNHFVCLDLRLPKKDIPTLPDNFNEFLAMIGA